MRARRKKTNVRARARTVPARRATRTPGWLLSAMFSAINEEEGGVSQPPIPAGETVEAKAARLTASYKQALLRLQAGDRAEAESASYLLSFPSVALAGTHTSRPRLPPLSTPQRSSARSCPTRFSNKTPADKGSPSRTPCSPSNTPPSKIWARRAPPPPRRRTPQTRAPRRRRWQPTSRLQR